MTVVVVVVVLFFVFCFAIDCGCHGGSSDNIVVVIYCIKYIILMCSKYYFNI